MLSHKPESAVLQALRIAAVYCVVSGLWIYFSDSVILHATGDPRLLSEIQTLKGLFFVAATSLLLYFLIRNSLRRVHAYAQAERQLKEEIINLLEAVADGYVAINSNWVYTYVNARGAEILGKPPAQLLGKSIWHVFPEGIGGSFETYYRKAMSERTPLHFEEFFEPYGIWYENWIYPGKDGITIFFRDITQKKKTEAALIASEAQYRSFFENSIDAFMISAPDGSISSANPAACAMFGKSEQELITGGRSAIINPDDPALQQLLHTRSIRGKVRGRLTLLRAGGTAFPAELTSAIFTSRNGALATSLIIRDISEREALISNLRLSEERYRMLFDFNPHPMWVYDTDSFRFLLVNRAAQEHYGYSEQEFYGMTILDIRTPDEVERLTSLPGLATDTVRDSGIWKHRTRSGNIISVSIRSHLLRLDGRSTRLVIAEDVTEKLRVQDQLRHYQEELSMLNAYLQSVREDEKKTMAREIHDELGQLLTAIKIDLGWVARAAGNQLPAWDKLQSALALVETVIARVQRISSELRPGMLDDLGLTPTLEWYLEEFQNRTAIACTALLDEVESIPQDTALVLFRVAQESLTNIARHAGATQARLELRKNLEGVTLTVTDNGSGITSEHTESKRSPGILGMRERVRALCGDFSIERLPAGGTCVRVCIPLAGEGS